MYNVRYTHNTQYLPFDNTVVLNDGRYTNRNLMTIV